MKWMISDYCDFNKMKSVNQMKSVTWINSYKWNELRGICELVKNFTIFIIHKCVVLKTMNSIINVNFGYLCMGSEIWPLCIGQESNFRHFQWNKVRGNDCSSNSSFSFWMVTIINFHRKPQFSCKAKSEIVMIITVKLRYYSQNRIRKFYRAASRVSWSMVIW